jgi:tetratricopeptide (TPR) repeat protein
LDYNKALEIDPKYVLSYGNRGLAYETKGQYDQAISDYNKTLEIEPRGAEAYYRRGYVYYLQKEYNKSWEDVKKAQALGYKIPPEFLNDLRKASGRQN